MTLQEVLKHRNVDNKPYMCDIEQWIGKLSILKLREIQELLKRAK